jgi:hypothetical protein
MVTAVLNWNRDGRLQLRLNVKNNIFYLHEIWRISCYFKAYKRFWNNLIELPELRFHNLSRMANNLKTEICGYQGVNINSTVFWDAIAWRLVDRHWSSEETYWYLLTKICDFPSHHLSEKSTCKMQHSQRLLSFSKALTKKKNHIHEMLNFSKPLPCSMWNKHVINVLVTKYNVMTI